MRFPKYELRPIALHRNIVNLQARQPQRTFLAPRIAVRLPE
tara:strand:+ start:2193 stop:2315 length:123 start_codon:yes stop_codon:yes gene_type:complete